MRVGAREPGTQVAWLVMEQSPPSQLPEHWQMPSSEQAPCPEQLFKQVACLLTVRLKASLYARTGL